MIEIKSRYSDKVLYTVRNAADVKAAAEEAISRGADLGGANLRGADLGDAYLRGANLGGAIWEKVAAKLEEALQVMNNGGRHWIKGAPRKLLPDNTTAYCSSGSIDVVCDDGTVQMVALWLLTSVCGGSVEEFNDHKDTSWEDVQAAFGLGIRHAKRFASA